MLHSTAAIEPRFKPQELVAVCFGTIITTSDHGVNGAGAEAHHIIPCHIGMEVEVAQQAVLIAITPHSNRQILAHLLGERAQPTGVVGQIVGELDTDDQIGTHIQADIHREVVDQASVSQQMSFPLNGREDTGDGHTGADSLGEDTAMQHHRVAIKDVGADTGERSGKLVEVD